jgi:hypothetical protein
MSTLARHAAHESGFARADSFCAATMLIVREAQCGSGKAESALQSNPPTAMRWLAHAVAERVSEKAGCHYCMICCVILSEPLDWGGNAIRQTEFDSA